MFIITTGRFSTYYKIKMLIKAIICSFYTLIYYLLSLMVLWGDWAQLGTLCFRSFMQLQWESSWGWSRQKVQQDWTSKMANSLGGQLMLSVVWELIAGSNSMLSSWALQVTWPPHASWRIQLGSERECPRKEHSKSPRYRSSKILMI